MKRLFFASLALGFALAACENQTPKSTETDAPDAVATAIAGDGRVNLGQLQWTRQPAVVMSSVSPFVS